MAQDSPTLKIHCNVPVKLKTGENVNLKVNIYHTLEKTKKGSIRLLLKNHQTQDNVDNWFLNKAYLQNFTTHRNKTLTFEFPFTVPYNYSDSFDLILVAKLNNLKDSIRFVIPTNKVVAFGKKS